MGPWNPCRHDIIAWCQGGRGGGGAETDQAQRQSPSLGLVAPDVAWLAGEEHVGHFDRDIVKFNLLRPYFSPIEITESLRDSRDRKEYESFCDEGQSSQLSEEHVSSSCLTALKLKRPGLNRLHIVDQLPRWFHWPNGP
ncbi:hypothetical protein DPEC_G00172140 [Dallia pectoralis]|uniref:Uncharacterized protein n=1 Tax=Dallia pectoralis TaxID=75939 RepID=A0ACC2GDK5_DALPE|nr:hypothetical protein DPEC_G00172140 [Dallia pectoralis]